MGAGAGASQAVQASGEADHDEEGAPLSAQPLRLGGLSELCKLDSVPAAAACPEKQARRRDISELDRERALPGSLHRSLSLRRLWEWGAAGWPGVKGERGCVAIGTEEVE